MAKGGGGEQYVTNYHASMHLGVCLGPVDQVRDVKIGEKSIGIPVQNDTGYVDVSKPELFGGPKKGGGVAGRIHFLFGKEDQVTPLEMATKHGRTPSTMSGYRGFLSLFFQATEAASGPLSGRLGFLWGSNQPVIPKISVTATRKPLALLPENAMIGLDANPAHIIAECLTDPTFGSGYSEEQIGSSFFDAAETLFSEGFGLSYIWQRSTAVEQFVNEVLHTISANLVFNLATGRWDLTLLRGDYQTSVLGEINPSNARLISFERKGWGETVNEIIVTWTNPQNEAEETVTVQNNATVMTQDGAAVSDSSRNYPGIRNQALAFRVGERDLRQASAPLASARVEVDRRFFNLKAGDVRKFRWPEIDVASPIVMRVVSVDPGRKGDPAIVVTLLEDLFSFGVSPIDVEEPVVVIPDQDPIDVQFFRIGSAPYYLIAGLIGDSAASQIEHPITYAWILAATGLLDIREIDVQAGLASPEGGLSFQEIATVDEPGRFEMPVALPIETTTVFERPAAAQRNFTVGAFLLLADEEREELCVVTGIFGLDITLRRGCLDTVPQDWPMGTVAWVVNANTRVADQTERAVGEEPEYRFLPITSRGRLAEEDATVRSGVLSDRQYLPLRPANLRVNGEAIPDARAAATGALPEGMIVSWSNRNRLTETALVLGWDDGDVDREEEQTTTIVVYDGVTQVSTITGLTGSDRTLTDAELGNPAKGDTRRIELFSAREGFESFQRSTIDVDIDGENLLAYSHDFSQWGVVAGETAAATDGAISGVNGASKIRSRNAPNTIHYKLLVTPVLTIGQEYVAAVLAKAAEVSSLRFYMNKPGFTTTGGTFNLTGSGSLGTPFGSPTGSGIENVGSGWYLCWFSFTATLAEGLNCIVRLGASDFVGNRTDGLYLDHAQLETGGDFSQFFIRKS